MSPPFKIKLKAVKGDESPIESGSSTPTGSKKRRHSVADAGSEDPLLGESKAKKSKVDKVRRHFDFGQDLL
jgi:hypothetical protein